MTAEEKAREVCGDPIVQRRLDESFAVDLAAFLQEWVCDFLDDPSRDVHWIEVISEHDGLEIAGYAANGTRRLYAVLLAQERGCLLLVVATKGCETASVALLGQSGVPIGNSVLIARLLHCAIVFLREAGVAALLADPVDERLRSHYMLMGFKHGEELALNDQAALTMAFEYIGSLYENYGLALDEP